MTSERIRVLIIDDEALLGLAAQDYLEDEGRFEAFVAQDAESGLDLLRRQAIDVCLVDLRLPGSNGIEFMLQAQDLYPALRFLVHTGSPEEQFPKAIMQDIPGFRGVLYKPVADMEVIVRALDNALR
ncbi:response regulator [Solidesulfovibrio carbinolicus]|uniref:Two-component system response regulator n=1 Tax=Solidesulfovibrio carbinolicus TaxID=296842 RepID=A0A4P6I3Z2_9BACT|nr:response regulator [Solidesulfovibrio carbinolicus]QAZ68649.1 two-component system response regulator [Solidesulfovibrio carbinolicus]